MDKRGETAGSLSLQAAADTSIYDTLEVGHDAAKDVLKQIEICASDHSEIFKELENFFIGDGKFFIKALNLFGNRIKAVSLIFHLEHFMILIESLWVIEKAVLPNLIIQIFYRMRA